ncbi:MAG: hypothetical protein QGH93_08250, partial [Gammaproteobacteria bacterium]|nr:hypothetical protein [Gammaproteobacteria bacterium]
PTVEDSSINVEDHEWGSSFEIAFGGYKQADKRQKVALTSDTETEGLRAGSWHIGPNTLITGIHLPENNSFVQYFFEAPLSDRRTKIFFVPTRNNNLGAENNEWINATYMNVADEDIAIIEELWPIGTPDNLTKELLAPGDAAVVKYREFLKTWENNGWRIDWSNMQNAQTNVAFAIPSPARRESGNWILDTVPVYTD